MIQINKDNIINEDNPIEDFSLNKKIYISGIELCICKIEAQYKSGDKYIYKRGSGFFCNIPDKNLKVLMTNNHVLNQEFLDTAKKLNYSIEENFIKKDYELNLEKKRYKYTDEELDFTIIEILKEDKILKFLEIDDFIYNKDYIEEKIVVIQYPLSQNLKISSGKIIGKQDNCLLYDVGTDGGSSGSPLILLDNLKIIGLHKAGYYKGEKKIKKNKINLGVPLNLIINKINYTKEVNNFSLKGFFNIFKSKNNTGKEKQVINNNKNENENDVFKDFFKFEKIEEIDNGFTKREKNLAKQNGFILIGEIGSGKKTLLNVLFGEKVAKDSNIYYYKLYNGKYISIILTPGIPEIDYDSKINEENLLKLVINIFNEGIQLKGVLFLINFIHERMDFEEEDTLIILNKLCPFKDFWKHLLIIYTHYFEDPDGDSLEEIKEQRYESEAYIFQSIMSKGKEFSDIKGYKEIRKIYLNSFWPIRKLKQEEKNKETRKKLEKEIEEMIFMDSLITKAEIKQVSNYKYTENEKYYLLNLIRIGFFDDFDLLLKEVEYIISKREININEYKKDIFKNNIDVMVLGKKQQIGNLYIY